MEDRSNERTIANHKNHCGHLWHCGPFQLCVGAGTVPALCRYCPSPEYLVALRHCGNWGRLSRANCLHSGLARVSRCILVRETWLARLSHDHDCGFDSQQRHRVRSCEYFQAMGLQANNAPFSSARHWTCSRLADGRSAVAQLSRSSSLA